MQKSRDSGDFDKDDTLSSLKEQTGKQIKQDPAYSGEIEVQKQTSAIDTLVNSSGKDEQSVGSSVGHTMTLTSDINIPLPRSLKPISNHKFLSASSSNVEDGCEKRTVGYS